MGIEIVILIIAAALAGAYVVKSGGVTPSGVTPSTTAPSGPVPPHLLAGAQLLTDQQIAQMEADAIGNHFTNASDKPRFISACLTNVLPQEQIVDPQVAKQCSGGMQYQGPPITLTALKDGSVVLGVAGTAAAGGFGAGAAGAIASIGISSGVLAGVTFGVGAVISVYAIISAHHAAAVKREQGLECALLPPANKSLAVIEQAVVTGVITIQQAQQALDKLYTDFVQTATGGLGGLEDRPGKLNAMGWYAHEIHAIILKKKNRYANLVS